METRFSFGGDEHLLCECAEEMSFEAFFKSLAAMRGIRESAIRGGTPQGIMNSVRPSP